MAFVLPLLVFHHGFSEYDCIGDVCTNNRVLWGEFTRILEKPVFGRNPHTGALILVDGKPAAITPLREGLTGIVIRDGIPTAVGWIGGLAVPVVLLLTALKLGRRKGKPSN